MNIWGWLFMLSSWGLILGLTAFCFYRVLIEPEEEL
jgi:protein-S-isoprenylcysteine O-methyltransferase Ste14